MIKIIVKFFLVIVSFLISSAGAQNGAKPTLQIEESKLQFLINLELHLTKEKSVDKKNAEKNNFKKNINPFFQDLPQGILKIKLFQIFRGDNDDHNNPLYGGNINIGRKLSLSGVVLLKDINKLTYINISHLQKYIIFSFHSISAHVSAHGSAQKWSSSNGAMSGEQDDAQDEAQDAENFQSNDDTDGNAPKKNMNGQEKIDAAKLIAESSNDKIVKVDVYLGQLLHYQKSTLKNSQVTTDDLIISPLAIGGTWTLSHRKKNDVTQISLVTGPYWGNLSVKNSANINWKIQVSISSNL